MNVTALLRSDRCDLRYPKGFESMPNVPQVLKEELTRLARREVRAVCNPLRKQVRSLRETVKKQQEIIGRLERTLSKMADVSAVTSASLFAPEEEGTRARATPASIPPTVPDPPRATTVAVASPDREILVALYNATDGPNWGSADNWLTDAPLGSWYGVDVDVDALA